MKHILELSDFYSLLDKKIYEHIVNIGHFDIIEISDLPPTDADRVNYLRRSYYKVSLVKGHSKVKFPEEEFELNGWALVFTHPSRPYQWQRISEVQQGMVCIFTAEFLKPFAKPEDFEVFNNKKSGVILLDDEGAEKLEHLLKNIKEDYLGSFRKKYDLLRHMLLEVIYRGEKYSQEDIHPYSSFTASERIAEMFFEYLERQFPITSNDAKISYRSPAAFAEKLNIHVNHLNKSLIRHTGKSTSVLISERIILEAKNLLAATPWGIKEIAGVLGFNDVNHFSSAFKRNAGISPKLFRARLD